VGIHGSQCQCKHLFECFVSLNLSEIRMPCTQKISPSELAARRSL
jgi:hypothetical protein